jgi:hypothetical protein
MSLERAHSQRVSLSRRISLQSLELSGWVSNC